MKTKGQILGEELRQAHQRDRAAHKAEEAARERVLAALYAIPESRRAAVLKAATVLLGIEK